MSTKKIKALRGFRGLVDNQFREVKAGEFVTVAELFARELVHSRKAEIVAEEPKPEPKPQGKKGEKDAG